MEGGVWCGEVAVVVEVVGGWWRLYGGILYG